MESNFKARISVEYDLNEIKKKTDKVKQDIKKELTISDLKLEFNKASEEYITKLNTMINNIGGKKIQIDIDTSKALESARKLAVALSKPLMSTTIPAKSEYGLSESYSTELQTAQSLAKQFQESLDSIARKNKEAFDDEEIKQMKQQYQEMINLFSQGLTTTGGIPQFEGQDLTIQKMRSAMASLKAETDKFNTASKQSTAELKQQLEVQKTQDKLAKIKATNAGFLSSDAGAKASVAIEEATKALEAYKNEATQVNKIDLEKKMSALNLAMAGAKKQTFSLSEMLATAGKKFLAWMSVTQMAMQAINAIKLMVNNVVELDTSLMELAKVSDMSEEALSNFADKAFEASAKLGRTGKPCLSV